MKLADYLQQHHITPADFTRKLGLSSSASVRRYILGERMPKDAIIELISNATGGLVGREDFASVVADRTIRQRRKKKFLYCSFSTDFVQHLNEEQLQDLGFDGWQTQQAANENISFPVWQAKQVLQHRLEIKSNGGLILDGRMRDIKYVIEAGNHILQTMGKSLIHYPGLNPIYRRQKSAY